MLKIVAALADLEGCSIAAVRGYAVVHRELKDYQDIWQSYR